MGLPSHRNHESRRNGRSDRRRPGRPTGVVVLVAFVSFVAAPSALAAPPAAEATFAKSTTKAAPTVSPRDTAVWDASRDPEVVLVARDTADLEDHGGYTGEYIFGMTKGVMRSTLTPALKPVVLLLTVPLDIVFLPFAAIGGFFR